MRKSGIVTVILLYLTWSCSSTKKTMPIASEIKKIDVYAMNFNIVCARYGYGIEDVIAYCNASHEPNSRDTPSCSIVTINRQDQLKDFDSLLRNSPSFTRLKKYKSIDARLAVLIHYQDSRVDSLAFGFTDRMIINSNSAKRDEKILRYVATYLPPGIKRSIEESLDRH